MVYEFMKSFACFASSFRLVAEILGNATRPRVIYPMECTGRPALGVPDASRVTAVSDSRPAPSPPPPDAPSVAA